MKLILKIPARILLSWMLIFYSCMKEYSYEGGKNNKSPLASARPDAVITLPTSSVLLMATSSAIPIYYFSFPRLVDWPTGINAVVVGQAANNGKRGYFRSSPTSGVDVFGAGLYH